VTLWSSEVTTETHDLFIATRSLIHDVHHHGMAVKKISAQGHCRLSTSPSGTSSPRFAWSMDSRSTAICPSSRSKVSSPGEPEYSDVVLYGSLW
jgi:hypothetical protein